MAALRYGIGTPPEDIHAIVALFNDGCSAMHLTNTDAGWLVAEDGYATDLDDLVLWIEAPPFNEWEPNFMSLGFDEYVP